MYAIFNQVDSCKIDSRLDVLIRPSKDSLCKNLTLTKPHTKRKREYNYNYLNDLID